MLNIKFASDYAKQHDMVDVDMFDGQHSLGSQQPDAVAGGAEWNFTEDSSRQLEKGRDEFHSLSKMVARAW